MATYHLSVKNGLKGYAAPHAAYICREGKYDKGKNEELIYTEHGNMPSWAQENPRDFWKAADEFERGGVERAGRSYREIEVALPNELDREQQIDLVKKYVKTHLGKDHSYTFAIHCPNATLNPSVKQPHAHIMFSERKLDGIERDPEHFFKQTAQKGKDPARGGAPKVREWNNQSTVPRLRTSWAAMHNAELKKYGLDARIDHRSLEDQKKDALAKGDTEKAAELDRSPEVHLGPKVAQRTAKEVTAHVATANTPQERTSKRDEYYEKKELSDRAYYVFLIRESRRAAQHISKLRNSRVVSFAEIGKSIQKRLPRLAVEIQKVAQVQGELHKQVISEKRAIIIAESVYSKGETKRLAEELSEHDKERAKFIEAQKKFNAINELSVSASDRKKYDENKKQLQEWEMSIDSWNNILQSNVQQLQRRLQTPQAREKIEKIKQGVLARNAPRREELKVVSYHLKTLRQQQEKLSSLREDIARMGAEKYRQITVTGDISDTNNLLRQHTQIKQNINKALGQLSRDKRSLGGSLRARIRHDDGAEMEYER